MKSKQFFITVIVLASLLFFSMAYPLLTIETSNCREEIGVNVAYAYFGEPSFDPQVVGLWRNYSDTNPVTINGAKWDFDVHALNYFIVLNITNYSNEPLYLNSIEVSAGPQLLIGEQGDFAGGNIILRECKETEFIPIWDELWSPNSHRLIFFSGTIGVHDLEYNSLSDLLYLYSRVEGERSNIHAYGTEFKQAQFKALNGSYLYNTIIDDNQMFIFYQDIEVVIGTKSQNFDLNEAP
ncbi:MAG: hypothetical protein ACQCN3_08885 [Candidatus Bathyarchaeia archaeon]